MFIRKLLRFFLLFSYKIALAQTPTNTTIGNITIASPNAAALGKFGDIPVSYHTGIPDISIPIYTVKAGSLELPVSLSYHASGLKVQEQASWVGAGWALNAGGVITRTVVGAPDDKGFFAAYTNKGYYTDKGIANYLFTSGKTPCVVDNTLNSTQSCPIGSDFPPQDIDISMGLMDGEPDLYFFNFNGHSGKFYFNDDRTPVCEPEQDLKITPNFPGTSNDPRGMVGFTITTSDGIHYMFGKNLSNDGNQDALDKTYNITIRDNQYTNHGAVSSWYLNKIVSADGQFGISLIYQAENYSYFSVSLNPVSWTASQSVDNSSLGFDLNKNFIDGVRLTKITFPNGEINFNTGSLRQDLSLGSSMTDLADHVNSDATVGARVLDNITVQSSDLCKKYKFYTSYFYDNTALPTEFTNIFPAPLNLTSDEYRLKLDKIQEMSCDNTITIPPYLFTYFSGTVPRKLSFGIDHWGFYNGVTNYTLFPTYTVVAKGNAKSYPGASRDAAFPTMQNGSLQKITYPTGGSSAFIFEPNTVFSSQTTLSNHSYASLVVNPPGNPSTSTNLNFNIPYSGFFNIKVINNAGGYSVNFSLTNQVTNQSLGTWTAGSHTTITPEAIQFAAGNYTATLAYPDNAVLSSGIGATATVSGIETTTNPGNVTVGGLRIKTITNSDGGFNNTVVTSYGYNFSNVVNGQSSGQLYNKPIYLQPLRNDAWGLATGTRCSPFGCLTCLGSYEDYYISPSTLRPMASSMGNHIGYAEVYVSQTGNGYSVYKYYSNNGTFPHSYDQPINDVCVRTLDRTTCDANAPNVPAPPVPFDPMRGELAYQAVYNQAGQMIKTTSYYPLYQFDSLLTPGLISQFFIQGYYGQNNPYGIKTYTEYNLQSAKKIMDSLVTIDFDPATGNSLSSTNVTYYLSKYHNGITKTSSYNSKGENLVTNYKNSYDYRITGYTMPDKQVTYYNDISGDEADLAVALAGVSESDANYQNLRVNRISNYRYRKAVHRQNLLAYRGNDFVYDPYNPVSPNPDTKSAYQTAHDNAKTAADAVLKPILELQDELMNVPIEVSSWRNNGTNNLTGATFTLYGYSTNPSTKVYPSVVQKLNLAAPSSTFTTSSVTSTSIAKDSRYLNETAVKYYLGNLVEVLPKNGVYNSYIWGNNNVSPIVKAVGVDQATLITAYNAASGDLSVLRSQASLANAQLFTYTYKLLEGISSETVPNKKVTRYEYDALGRLRLVRDHDNTILKRFDYQYQQPQ